MLTLALTAKKLAAICARRGRLDSQNVARRCRSECKARTALPFRQAYCAETYAASRKVDCDHCRDLAHGHRRVRPISSGLRMASIAAVIEIIFGTANTVSIKSADEIRIANVLSHYAPSTDTQLIKPIRATKAPAKIDQLLRPYRQPQPYQHAANHAGEA